MMEDLIYRRLLDWYYLNEKPIPSDCIQAARLIQAKDHFADVEQVLNEFFTSTNEGWINKRADEEISHFKAKSEQASKAGKASAQARLNGRSTDVQPNNNHKPLTINQINTEPTSCEAEPFAGTYKKPVNIKTFLEDCEKNNVKRIPETDPVFDFAESNKIPMDMIKVCWWKFVRDHSEKKKRYQDWRAAFRNCVRDSWYSFWIIEADGTVKETTKYRAAKNEMASVKENANAE